MKRIFKKGNTMKTIGLFLLILAVGFLTMATKCSDTAITNGLAMGAGEGVWYVLNKRAPGAVQGCAGAFDKRMQDTMGLDPIPAEYMIRYYNESVAIISGQVDDEYFIVRRMSYMMTMLGAEFLDETNTEMLSIQPIPRRVMLSFEFGYDTGKLQYLRDVGI